MIIWGSLLAITNKNAEIQEQRQFGAWGSVDKFGKFSTKIGRDGKVYKWLEMSGTYRGRTGTFEFIKDNSGVINHRFFNVR